MRQKLGESGSMLEEKRAAIERNTDNYRNMCNCFPSPVNFISPFFLATILPNPLVLALCVLSSLFPGLPLQIYSQFDFFYPLLLPHLRHIPLPLKSPLHLLSPFALSPLIFPSPLLLEANQ